MVQLNAYHQPISPSLPYWQARPQFDKHLQTISRISHTVHHALLEQTTGRALPLPREQECPARQLRHVFFGRHTGSERSLRTASPFFTLTKDCPCTSIAIVPLMSFWTRLNRTPIPWKAMTRDIHPTPGHSRIRCNIPGLARDAASAPAGVRANALALVSRPGPSAGFVSLIKPQANGIGAMSQRA